MKAPDLKSIRKLSRTALHVLATSFGLSACSDPVSTPSQAREPLEEIDVTMPLGAVAAGATFWVSLDLRHPCWNEEAVVDVTVSWDASRLNLAESLAGGHIEADASRRRWLGAHPAHGPGRRLTKERGNTVTDQFERLTAALADRYRIERELGAGCSRARRSAARPEGRHSVFQDASARRAAAPTLQRRNSERR